MIDFMFGFLWCLSGIGSFSYWLGKWGDPTPSPSVLCAITLVFIAATFGPFGMLIGWYTDNMK